MTLQVLAKCKSLTFLCLSVNFYGESLPVEKNFISLGDFPKLQFFSLGYCNFKPGPIPKWLSTLKSLRGLTLSGNRLTGQVPSELGALPNLFSLWLDSNSLCGELPLSLWQLPALIYEKAQTDLMFSQFELPVFLSWSSNPNQFAVIRSKGSYYRGLYLSYNALSGTIPEEIGNLQNLQQLYLEHNHFSGHIPAGVSKLKRLERINLSNNTLTGEIPTSLASLNFLSYFNVAYNDLEGPIPTGGQFGSFKASKFEGNPGLCGEPLNHSCSNAPSGSKVIETNASHDYTKLFMDGLFVGFASGFSGILVVIASYVLFNYYKWRQGFF